MGKTLQFDPHDPLRPDAPLAISRFCHFRGRFTATGNSSKSGTQPCANYVFMHHPAFF